MTRRIAPLLVLAIAGCGAPDAGASLAPDMALPTFSQPQSPPRRPPDHTVGGFTARVPTLTLAPGQEAFPCFIFPLDVQGPSLVVGGASLTVGPGLHHGNLTSRPSTSPDTGTGIRPCPANDVTGSDTDVARGGQVMFASSTQIQGDEWQTFPPGMGYRLKRGWELVARMHYLNASDQPVDVAPVYQWYTIDESTLTTELGPFIWVYSGFTIPAGETTTVTGSCDLSAPMHLVNVLPHMHKLGVELDAAFKGGPLDGKPFLHSPGYDPDKGVLVQYRPAIDLGQGDGMTFSCTWRNTLDKTVFEGTGDNEMCMVFGYAWPANNAFTALAKDGSCVVLGHGPAQ